MDSEELKSALIGGLEPVTVKVLDYDPLWPRRFEQLAVRVRAVLGTKALIVEHIGSTAVPGLAAKPIIDILVVVDDVNDEAGFVAPLQDAGFVLRVREPGHRMMRTSTRDVHLHFTILMPTRSVTTSSFVTGCARTPRTATYTKRRSANWPAGSGTT